MSERHTFVISALAAECGASVAFYALFPTNPICVAFSNLLNYAGQHAPLALLLWLISLAGAWIFYGSKLLRPRQNLSTKVSFLIKLGITGVIIDNIVSLYQFEDSVDSRLKSN